LEENFSLGERLREFRQNLAMSQEQLANAAEITPAYLGQVERGTKHITVHALAKICAALNISLSEFFSTANVKDRITDKISDQILSQLIGKTDSEKQMILKVIKAIFSVQK